KPGGDQYGEKQENPAMCGVHAGVSEENVLKARHVNHNTEGNGDEDGNEERRDLPRDFQNGFDQGKCLSGDLLEHEFPQEAQVTSDVLGSYIQTRDDFGLSSRPLSRSTTPRAASSSRAAS